jgi:cardiolipin synthase
MQAMQGPAARMQAVAMGLGLPAAVRCDGLAIHPDGAAALERLKALVLSARQTLEVSTFVLGRDALGTRWCACSRSVRGTGCACAS